MKSKDNYIGSLHKKIDEWNSDIDRLPGYGQKNSSLKCPAKEDFVLPHKT